VTQHRADERDATVAEHRAVALRIAVAVLNDSDAAEDVAQETAVRLVAARPGLAPADVSRWVYRVTINLCRDQLRVRKRRDANVVLSSLPDERTTQPYAQPDRDMDLQDARAALNKAMHSLTPEHRKVLELRYIAGLQFAEIALMTSTAQGTIASRVFRALQRLGDLIDARHMEVLE
jgi:RNA polymerase sigma-70 factor (ECF subfamily)